QKAFPEILRSWRCLLLKFGGEDDHVHLLVEIQPAPDTSRLVDNLKSASS
ncbi:MAG TPA: IS200/IS605 family transposase, partial [Nitrospiraceae bacterium]|nr:IS200/IS605 family transposase [Nitrospiraceae bacterium]